MYDLAQPYFVGMPHYPTHPPFLFSLTKKHGDLTAESGMSSAAEAITLGGHVGTGEDHLPAVGLPCDGDRVGSTLNGA